MDEEMIMLRKVMPVELAIKRELEYRRRMEALKKQCQAELKPLVIMQESQQSQAGIEKDVPASNSLRSLMQQISSSCQPVQKQIVFACKACQMDFAGAFHLCFHIESQEHKNQVAQMKKRKEAISNPIWCELCRASASSFSELEKHINGSRHTSMLAEFENAQKVNKRQRL